MGGFGENYNQTAVHPVGLLVLILCALGVLFAPRRLALMPFLLLICLIPSGQRIVISGLDWTFLRILTVVGLARVTALCELVLIRFNSLDVLVAGWVASGITLCSMGSPELLVNRLGWGVDSLAVYLLFRVLVRDMEDLLGVFRTMAGLSIVVAAFFLIEWCTQRNLFGVMGGVPLHTDIRDGRLRVQGAYSHSILAGTFWASVMPWIYGAFRMRWTPGKSLLALLPSFLIVICTASSTPILVVLASFLAVSLFRIRNYVWVFRWGFLALLVMLHLVMKAPVWHLLARANILGSSTGWHRYKIFDTFVNNFEKWWLVGERDVMSWGVWAMRDVTNQFIVEGLNGGLLTLAMFIAMLVFAFHKVRQSLAEGDSKQKLLCWCVGSSLFAHVVAFWGVSYFGQITMLLMLNLAICGALPQITRSPARVQRSSPRRLPSRHAQLQP